MIYICSPYTSSDPVIREARFEAACRITAELIRQGKPTFSPVAYSHPLCRYSLPLDWQFWQRIDLAFLAICDEVIVLKLDGWERSVGVKAEIAAARTLGKPVTLVASSDLGVSDILVPYRAMHEQNRKSP